MAKNSGKILIIDHDDFSRDLYQDLLKEEGHEVHLATSEADAFALLEKKDFNVVITEAHLLGGKPFSVLTYVNEHYPKTSVIITTNSGEMESAVYALKAGAKDYLRKPVTKEEFKRVVQSCLEQQLLFRENQEFKSFLSLFETCHRISGCLEADRFFALSLHSLCQELGARNGFVVKKEQKTEIMPLGAPELISPEQWIALLCQKLHLDDFLDCEELKIIENMVVHDVTYTVLLLPIVNDQHIRATFTLFFESMANKPGTRDILAQKARFIARQIGISWENVRKFSHARGQAYIDDLTGLYNARYLSIILEKELKRSKRFNTFLSLLFMDLDHFKTINDRFGHRMGSRVLVEVGGILRSCLRDIDVAARYGGDEFTVVLTETDSGGATKVAERIRASLENFLFLKDEGKNANLTACIGIASFPEHANSVADLMEMADQAMYRGKNTTRNVVYIFNPNQ